MVVGAPPTGAGLKSAGQPSVFGIECRHTAGHIDADNGLVLWNRRSSAGHTLPSDPHPDRGLIAAHASTSRRSGFANPDVPAIDPRNSTSTKMVAAWKSDTLKVRLAKPPTFLEADIIIRRRPVRLWRPKRFPEGRHLACQCQTTSGGFLNRRSHVRVMPGSPAISRT